MAEKKPEKQDNVSAAQELWREDIAVRKFRKEIGAHEQEEQEKADLENMKAVVDEIPLGRVVAEEQEKRGPETSPKEHIEAVNERLRKNREEEERKRENAEETLKQLQEEIDHIAQESGLEQEMQEMEDDA